MSNSEDGYNAGVAGRERERPPINIVQRGNLKVIEETLRKQWRLGQNMVLCWSSDERGLLVLLVPHYFLGNYSAQGSGDNEAFVRKLISGKRRTASEEMLKVAERLEVAPTFIKLNAPLDEEPGVLEAVEQIIKRYGLSFVDRRAVLLFDIVDFSLHSPFEQASQLNSLSYSMNSAYNKLLTKGIEINFARTTTGDGYYVWNRDLGPYSHQDLFVFLLLVVADNAAARAASSGNTVPMIRSAYHIGSHYELYQAEGVNPTVFSYIVGDVTIELARMLDLAQPGQLLIGDFEWLAEISADGAAPLRSTPAFIRQCQRELQNLTGLQLARRSITGMDCRLSDHHDEQGESHARRFLITDKHGLTRHAYNLEATIQLADGELQLGLDGQKIHCDVAAGESSTDAAEDLSGLLRKRAQKRITED
ncbi:MAG: hypothetical protein AAGI11_03780 [Pseudomonadota bacterium]